MHAQDLGPYPLPAPSCTVLSSVDGGHAGGGFAAGGGNAPADPAAQEELFVDGSGTSAVWRTLGGQIAHASFRSVVLGPSAALEGGLRGAAGADAGGHGAITQAVRCRFPTLLEGWSSTREGGDGGEERRRQRQKRRRGPWSVCILRNPDLITVHHPRGDSHDITLPCEARLLQPLGEGMLVQRFAGGGGDGGGGDGDGLGLSSAASGREEQEAEVADGVGEAGLDPSFSVPSLFSLLHPLDELRPVALLPPAITAERGNENGCGGGGSGGGGASTPAFPLFPTAQPQRLVCDASERVVFARGGGDGGTGRDSCLLLTYHAGRRRHSLWAVLPVPEPEREPEQQAEQHPESLMATAGAGVSMSGSTMMDQSSGGAHSWVATPGLSSTRGAEASSLSSTLLGVSALKSPSSGTGLGMMDTVLDSTNPRRDRLSAGGGSTGRGRLSAGGGGGGGAGRRASSGSTTSWIGAGNTRNEALASALGLGQSALGVASNMLSLSAPTGHGGGERGVGVGVGGVGGVGGADSFLLSADLTASSSMALGGGTLPHHEEDEDEEEEEGGGGREGPQPIRPHLGVSLVWREAEDSPRPAQHVFCAEGGTPTTSEAEKTTGNAAGSSSAGGTFLLCFVDGEAAKLHALSVSFPGTGGGSGNGHQAAAGGGVKVAEAFTLPCRSAVGLCATGGREGEGTPAAAIAADILVLDLEGSLVLYRGESPVTRVAVPPTTTATTTAAPPREPPGSDGEEQPESISEAVGSCFTLTTRGGNRRRLRLSLDPASPLVSACLGAWDSMLSAALAASLRADIAGAAYALAGHEERPHRAGGGGGVGKSGSDSAGTDGGGGGGRSLMRGADGDLDWAALVSVVQNLVAGAGEAEAPPMSGKRKGREDRRETRQETKVQGGGGGGGDGDAWASLLSSPFHDEFSRTNVLMLSGFDRTAGSASNGSPLGGPSESQPPPPAPLELLQTRRSDFLAEAGAAFDALHLVLEDLKTCRLTLPLVPRLASLLLSITRLCGGGGAEMRDFADHYWRDSAGCGRGGGEAASMVDGSGGGRGTGGVGGGALPNRLTRFAKVRHIKSPKP